MKRITALILIAAITHLGFAQEATPSLDQIRAMSREERIKAHQRRIEQIIQENKRRQEEEARKAAQARVQQQTAATQPAAPTPPSTGTSPLPPRGPVQVYTPPQQAAGRPSPTPPPQASSPSAARAEARSIMFFRPFDSIVKAGDTFITELVANTKDAAADEFFVCLSFPPQNLNLLALDFGPVTSYLQQEVEYAYDSGNGKAAFHIKLSEPVKFSDRAVAVCYWEAVSPSDISEVRFEFDDGCETDIRLQGQSILGTSTGRYDGVIHANVMIRPRTSRNAVMPIGEHGLFIGSGSTENFQPQAQLTMKPDAVTAAVGDDIVLEIALNNPNGQPFDRVQLYVQFDPDYFEVVDVDRGNWIRRGVNLEDGFAHEEFPFDFHKTNSADNEQGIIAYEEGAEIAPLRSTGTLARIHLKAKRAGSTYVALVRNKPGTLPTTNVTYLSQTVLANYPENLNVLSYTELKIKPAPLASPSNRP
ncbi:MAG: cohesin domain-containing protein [Candidatus Sumerlaeaceae bacterium]|nr:cohesin domain-containing protein [Candidatus Sumerlaeaceae bacterium]